VKATVAKVLCFIASERQSYDRLPEISFPQTSQNKKYEILSKSFSVKKEAFVVVMIQFVEARKTAYTFLMTHSACWFRLTDSSTLKALKH